MNFNFGQKNCDINNANYINEEFGKALNIYETKALQQSETEISNKSNEYFFKEFLSSLRDVSLEISNSLRHTDSELSKSAFLESSLWELIIHLTEFNQSIFNINENKDLKLVFHLKNWLENIIPQPVRPLNISKFATNNSTFGKTEEEKINETTFYQFCFELLMTGEFGKAIEECVSANNLQLAMIISGYKIDFNDQTGQNENISWRKALKKLSHDKELCNYEKLIYKYLSGSSLTEPDDTLEIFFKNNYSWEYQLLFSSKVIIDNEFETVSNKFSPIDIKFELKKALDLVFGQEIEMQNIKDIMASLILNTENELLSSAKEALIKTFETDANTQFKSEKYLLRVIAHVCIAIDISKPKTVDLEIKNLFLSTYVSSLRLNKLYSIIPSYVMFLNGTQRLITYSNVLNDVLTPQDKEEQKLLAVKLGLPYKDALRKMADDLFKKLSKDDSEKQGVTFMNNAITFIQKEIINGIDWLMIAGLNNEAIGLLLASIKNFLINGSVGAFRLLIEKTNISQIIAICQLDDKEFESSVLYELLKLDDCFSALEKWHAIVKNTNGNLNIAVFADTHRALAEKLMYCVLNFFKDIDESKDIHFYQVKVLYVPYFVIQLHKALDFAADVLGKKSLAEDALDLVAIVAHDEQETYKLLQLSNRLEEYVCLVTKTYIKVQGK
ncbi:hypothetical protein QEN19_000687 [Hanseniaspora menglaensis]